VAQNTGHKTRQKAPSLADGAFGVGQFEPNDTNKMWLKT